jgi:tRNA threonylcarbamoyladenosine biosynthesis protein TsaB
VPELLAIETSAESCSVALGGAEGVHQLFEHAPMRHAERLLPMIEALLEASRMRLADLDAIAFGRGPGSFTSLRIGIGVVQGLAWGAELPVVPVSSLAAAAQAAAERGALSGQVVVALDARMNEVYWARFLLGDDGVVKAVAGEHVSSAEHLLSSLDGREWHAVGNGFARFPELAAAAAQARSVQADTWPSARAVWRLAMDAWPRQPALPAAGAQPVYLRNDVADKPRKATGRSPGR